MNTTLELELKKHSENYSKELKKVEELDNKKQELPQDRLKKLGFSSSFGMDLINQVVGKDLEFLNTINKACEILAFIREVKDCFGENVIVIKRSDFVSIVEKYNLQCGTFDNYTGVVPEKNIDEIESVFEIIKKFYMFDEELLNKYVNLEKVFVHTTRDRDGIERERRYMTRVNSFSMTRINKFKYRKELKIFSRIPLLYNTGRGFDWNADKQFGKEGFGRAMTRVDRNESYRNLFICAPRQEMKNGLKIITLSKKQAEDPFICSFCDYGIIIYTAWGKEAEDEMLNKYKNFLGQ